MKQVSLAVVLVIVLVLVINQLMNENPTSPSPVSTSSAPDSPAPAGVAVVEGGLEAPTTEVVTPTVEESRDPAAEGEETEAVLWSVAGRVLGVDDTPFAGAEVELIRVPLNPWGWTGMTKAQSDEEGFFLLEAHRDYVGPLEVRAEGMVGRRLADVRPREGNDPTITIHLTPGGTIHGRVVDFEERPVAAAEVAAGAPRRGSGVFGGLFLAPADRDDRLWPMGTSAADGTFTLTGIPEGACSLVARHEEFGESESVNLPPGASEATLVMRNLCYLAGTVIDTQGAPLEGILVKLRPIDFARTRSGNLDPSGEQQTTSDPAGTFSFTSTHYGMHSLVTEAETFAGNRVMVSLGEGENPPVEVVLIPAASVSGRVLDSAGNPLRAEVTASARSTPGGFGGLSENTHSQDDGTFFLQPVASNKDVILEVKHRDHPTLMLAPRRFLPGENNVGDLVLADGLHLRGVVLDPGGSPLSGARVSVAAQEVEGESTESSFSISFSSEEGGVFSGPDDNLARGFTDSKGEFQLTLEEGGALTLEGSAKGFLDAEPQALSVSSSIDGLVLRLRTAETIGGIVLDRSGNPIPGVRLSFSQSQPGAFFFPGFSDNDGVQATSGPDGTFSAEVEADGRFRVKVAANQRWLLKEKQFIEAGITTAEVMVVDAGRIEGRVRDASSGQAIGSFNLHHSKNQSQGGFIFGGSMGTDYVDPEGSFEIDGLEGTTYKLTVKADGYVPLTEEIEVELGRTTVVDIALMHSATIIGRLLDSAGEAVSGAAIAVYRPGENSDANLPGVSGTVMIAISDEGDGAPIIFNGMESITSDNEGRFRATGLEDGDWQVKVTHSDFQELVVEVADIALGRVTDIGEQWLKKGAVIGGKIIMPDGSSPDFGVLTAQRIDGGGNETQQGHVTSGENGSANWRIGGLGAGRWRISGRVFSHGGDNSLEPIQGNIGAIEVRLAAEEVRTLDLTATSE